MTHVLRTHELHLSLVSRRPSSSRPAFHSSPPHTQSAISQINPIQQLSPRPRLSPFTLCLIHIPCPLPIRIHRIILALRKPILRAPIMRNHSTKDSSAVIARDRANHDSVCAWRLVIREGTGFEDWEFEVGLLGVGKGEVLVIIVGVRIFVST